MDDDRSNPPSPSPSSSSQPLDQSLVRAFGALEAVLTDLTTSSQSNASAVQRLVPQVSDLIKLIKARSEIDDKHRGMVLDTLVKLTDSFDKLAQQEGIAVGATVDARNALIAAKEQIDQRLKAVQDAAQEISGEHPTYDPEGAPRLLQVIILHLTNFSWKNKAKLVGWIMAAGSVLGYAVHKIAPFWRELIESFR